jgi:hypothetical protein
MLNIQGTSGVHADAVAMSVLSGAAFHPGMPVMPVMPAVAHRAGWALTAVNPQYKRRTAAATSTSVKRGTT